MGIETTVFVILTLFRFNTGNNICKQYICEENNICEITHQWKNSTAQHVTFTWYRFSIPVSKCTSSENAQTYPKYSKWIGSSCEFGEKFISSTLKFSPAGKYVKSTWYLKANADKNETSLCKWQPRIYRNIQNPNCHLAVQLDTIILKCVVPKAYPNSLCIFTDKSNNININNEIYHNFSRVSGHLYHVISDCSIILNVSKTDHQFYNFNVTVYPNISNTHQDQDYGVNLNVSFIIEYPNVTFLCDSDVKEDEMFTCICKKSDKSNLTTEVHWYSNDLIVSKANDTAILQQIAHKNLTEFKCLGLNALGWKSKSLIFRPKIRDKVDLETFECPDKQQHICGQHGLCFYKYEFCTQDEKVESCFPPNISKLSEWCLEKGQFDVSLMRNEQCELACIARFNLTMLNEKKIEMKTRYLGDIEVLIIGLSLLMLIIITSMLFSVFLKIAKKKTEKTLKSYSDKFKHDFEENRSLNRRSVHSQVFESLLDDKMLKNTQLLHVQCHEDPLSTPAQKAKNAAPKSYSSRSRYSTVVQKSQDEILRNEKRLMSKWGLASSRGAKHNIYERSDIDVNLKWTL